MIAAENLCAEHNVRGAGTKCWIVVVVVLSVSGFRSLPSEVAILSVLSFSFSSIASFVVLLRVFI